MLKLFLCPAAKFTIPGATSTKSGIEASSVSCISVVVVGCLSSMSVCVGIFFLSFGLRTTLYGVVTIAILLLFFFNSFSVKTMLLKLKYQDTCNLPFCKNWIPNVSLHSPRRVFKMFVPKMIGVLAEYLVSGTTRNKHDRCAESGRLTDVFISATMYPNYGSGSPSAHSIFNISSRARISASGKLCC